MPTSFPSYSGNTSGRVRLPFLLLLAVLLVLPGPALAWGPAAANVPLDSPVYQWLDKLAGFGLVDSAITGIKPYTKAEAARLVLEAEGKLAADTPAPYLAREIIAELKRVLAREIAWRSGSEPVPTFDLRPVTELRFRTVYLDGVPRNYERLANDKGGDGVFGIGSGLRPSNPYPSPVQQHGTEGTPLFENNQGIRYDRGFTLEWRFTAEATAIRYLAAAVEPMLLYGERDGTVQALLNRGYLKVGGGELELEVGRDENWYGFGQRGALVLSNNARNFDLIKLSSPEPVTSRYLWDLKYSIILSRFDGTTVNGAYRKPYFLGMKLSFLPNPFVEFGLNMGRQLGGPEVDNSFRAYLKGIFGGTSSDNTNNVGGIEVRFRLPFLRNAEIYGEFVGEDSAGFWPTAESYLTGIFLPRLSRDGADDLRFEFFWGNPILYTNSTFPQGYIYKGMPLGHSQGGATTDYLLRYRHWFSARQRVILDYFHTDRGNVGQLPGQAVERKDAVRAGWEFPLTRALDIGLRYGWEQVTNYNLVGGDNRTNQLASFELRGSF